MCFTGGNRSEIKVLKAEISSLVLPTPNLYFSSRFFYIVSGIHASLAFCFPDTIPLPCCATKFQIFKFKDIVCTNSYLYIHQLWT